MDNPLLKLANKHNTDKGYKHNYIGTYYKYFKKFQDKEIKLLELGISQGSSLFMWKDFFPKGTIIGLDIFKGDHYEGKVDNIKSKLDKKGIEYIVGSQSDLRILPKVINKCKDGDSMGFDIIIDDASHRPKDQQISMMIMFSLIKDGGYYVIEDLDYPCDPKESTLSVIKNYQKTGKWASPFLTTIQNRLLTQNINSCELHRKNKIVFFS